eukprot:TRINITY_DN52683_c0_g1_i1.p1 TRINITY_DN52683_c0_g1~~TRINITY_DN52683_c0_g1_i1.p1  ORF type:complete len:508 (+),score=85.75 TRINITY_DN52683_c0_g1_i1:70-1593(+)
MTAMLCSKLQLPTRVKAAALPANSARLVAGAPGWHSQALLFESGRQQSTSSSAPPSRWRIGCWNQHRVGSYAQRNCPWVPRLKAETASGGREIGDVLKALPVDYEAREVRDWAASFDAVALQEVDGALRRVLLETHSDVELQAAGSVSAPHTGHDRLVESRAHVDGRGVEVDCTNAIFLSPADEESCRIVARASAELRLPLSRGDGYVVRDHAGVLLHKAAGCDQDSSRGRWLILSSLHLHPPKMADEVGATYVDYVAPLAQMVETLLDAVPLDARGEVTCALVGDFNTTPEDFAARTSGTAFWQAFSAVASADGSTAHGSNPCEVGDFGLIRGFGDPAAVASQAWRCGAQGEADFATFEVYCEQVTTAARVQLGLRRAIGDLGKAADNLERALLPMREEQRNGGMLTAAARHAFRGRPPPPPHAAHSSGERQRTNPEPTTPKPAAPTTARGTDTGPGHAASMLLAAISEVDRLRGSVERLPALCHRPLRKGLLQSDHRPLTFEEMT